MMSETSSSPKRPRLDFDDSKDDQYDKFKGRDPVDEVSSSLSSKSRKRVLDIDDEETKDDDSKSKSFNREATPREHTLVMRLANKEQELQESLNQIQEMKQAQTQKTAHLRSMLLDPAINLVFQRMAKEMDEHKEKLKQKQNELSAWKFTPDSQTGMRLMAKCRMLLQENGDLGKMISSGRTARLEGEIALHKALVTEMKKNQKELDEFVGDLEEDVEGMQGMIFMLQEQLKEAREQIARLQQENEQLRTLRMPPDPEPGGEEEVVEPMSVWDSHSSVPRAGSPLASGSPPQVSSEPPTALRTSSSVVGDRDSSQLPFAQFTVDKSPGAVSKVMPDSGLPSREDEEKEEDASTMDTAPCRASVSPPPHQPQVSPSSSHPSQPRTSETPPPPSPLGQTTSSNGDEVSSGAATPQEASVPPSGVPPGLKPSSSDSSCDSSSAPTLTPAPCMENMQDHPNGDNTERTSQPDTVCTLNGKSEPPLSSSIVTEDSQSSKTELEAPALERTNHSDNSNPRPHPVSNCVDSTVVVTSGKERTEEVVDSCQEQQPILGESKQEGTVDSEAKENLVNGTLPAVGQDL